MFAVGFLVRLLKAALAFLIFSGILAGVVTFAGILFRWVWDVYERNFNQQAKWMMSKVHILKPYKSLVVVFVTVMVTLCCAGLIALIYLSGQSASGDVLP